MRTTKIGNTGFLVWYQLPNKMDPSLVCKATNSVSSAKRTAHESLTKTAAEFCTRMSTDKHVRYMHKALARRKGQAILMEMKHEDRVEVKHLFSMRISTDKKVEVFNDQIGMDQPSIAGIGSLYRSWQQTVGPRQVRPLLDWSIKVNLQGVTIPNLPAYFIEHEAIEKWNEVALGIKDAAIACCRRAYFTEAEIRLDGSVADAVQQGMLNEVSSTVDEMIEAAHHGRLTDHGAEDRLETMSALQQKLLKYEGLFSHRLDSCRQKIAELSQALVVSEIVDSGSEVFDELLGV